MGKFVLKLTPIIRLYTFIFTPLYVCFYHQPPMWASVFEVMSELVLLANAMVPFICGMEDMETKSWVTSWSEVFRIYPCQEIFVDTLSAIPWHMIWWIDGQQHSILLRLSLLRLMQLPNFNAHFIFGQNNIFSSSKFGSVHPNQLRVAKLMCIFFLMVHLVACGYYLVASNSHGEWGAYATDQSLLFVEWTHAYYWALCGVLGENMGPNTFMEAVYNSIVIALGVVLNSCIIGCITSLLGTLDENAACQKSKLDAVIMFFHKNHVPPELSAQVFQYYKYKFQSHFVDHEVFQDLSDSLRLKIDICIHWEFIQKCQIFSRCPPDCIVSFVNIISKNPIILVPNEVIFRKGTVGDVMFFCCQWRNRAL